MRRRMRVRMAAGVVALAVALIAAGCGGSGSGSGAKSADLLRIGTAGQIDSLNLFAAQHLQATELLHINYPSLIGHDASGRLIPDFATSWTYGPQFRTLTLKVHTNGKWSDGVPLTAKDVAFTLNLVARYGATAAGLIGAYLPTVQRAEAPDPGTVVVHFNAPSPTATSELLWIPVLPEHVFGKLATGDGHLLTSFAAKMPLVGGGPFYIASYTPRQVAILNRNPYYYGPAPQVKRIGFTLYSNPDALVQGFQNGEVDAIERVPYSAVKTVQSGGAQVQQPLSFTELWLAINDSPKATKHLELHDLRVRHAFDLASDRDSIVRTAFFGSAVPGASVVPPALSALRVNTAAPAFDIAQANQILDQAGYKRGSNGIRVANGHPMSYKVISARDATGAQESAFGILQSDFRKIGVQLTLQALDAAAVAPALAGPKMDFSGFDLYLISYVGGYDSSDFNADIVCAGIAGGYTTTGTCDKKFDALDTTHLSAATQSASLKAAQDEQRYILTRRPLLVLAYAKNIYAVKPAWTGLTAGPLGWFLASHQSAEEVGKK